MKTHKNPTNNIVPPSVGSSIPAGISQELEQRLAALEAKGELAALTTEGQLRELMKTEIRQRIMVRWLSIAISLVTMSIMIAFIWHFTHEIFVGPLVLISPVIAVVLFGGPILSISAITIMLSIGAFRRFKDDDIDGTNLASVAFEGVKSGMGTS